MGEFTYLPYCIVLVCAEYLLLVKATLVWTARRDHAAEDSRKISSSVSVLRRSSPVSRRWLGIFDQRSFLSCCSGLYGRNSSNLLFMTRLASCLFFIVIGMGFNFARDEIQGHWQFFTNWNVGLISGYYSLACAASAYYLYALAALDTDADMESDASVMVLLASLDTSRLRFVGTFLSVYFCVASVTAVFVTTVNFVLLDPTPRFFNMVAHLFTTVSFIIEMSLNSIQLRKNELVLNVTWIMLWLMFIWPVVWLGAKPEWPYDFLDSSTPAIFIWFQVLFIVYFLIFFAWYKIVEYKLNKFSNRHLVASNASWAADDMSCEKAYHCLTSEI